LEESNVKMLTETLMTGMLKRVFLLTAAVALSSTVLVAQGHPGGAAEPPTHASPDPNSNQTSPNPDDPMARDRGFAKKSLENGYAVVKMSEMAQQNSQRDDVKQFAQKAADDQKQTNGRLEEFAKQLGMGLPGELSRRDQKTVAKLQGLSGAKFDEEYLKAMQKDQQNDVKGYTEEAGKTKDPTLQGVLKQDGATISQHVETIKTLSQSGK
jgi:putative membrane protein